MPSRILFLEVRAKFGPVETQPVAVGEQNEALGPSLHLFPHPASWPCGAGPTPCLAEGNGSSGR